MQSLIETLDMKVNKERMAQCANEYWSQASTVVGYLVKEHGMSYRTGHQILALMMQTVKDKRIPPSQVTPDVLEDAVEKYTGRRIGVTQELLNQLFDAMYCVRERKYRGGGAPERVVEHITVARERLAQDRKFVVEKAMAIEAAGQRMDQAFVDLQKKYV